MQHRLWSVPELVDMVLGELSLLPDSKAPLARLARTGRLFRGPALQHLYKRIDGKGLHAICTLMHPASGDKFETSFTVRRTRFSVYADLVQSVTLDSSPVISVRRPAIDWNADHISTALATVEAENPFPRLQELVVHQLNLKTFHIVLRLIAPTLTHFTVNSPHSYPRARSVWSDQEYGLCIATILRRVRAINCQIVYLQLCRIPVAKAIYECELLDLLQSLRTLTAFHMDYDLLEIAGMLSLIAQIPSLTSFTVYNGSYSPKRQIPSILDDLRKMRMPFQTLVELTFAGTMYDVAMLLSTVKGPLKHVSLDTEYPVNLYPVFGQTIQAIRNFASALESVALHFWSAAEPQPDSLPIPWDTYAPVLQCRKLTSLSIVHTGAIRTTLGDLQIRRLAESLPLLNSLDLSTGPTERPGLQSLYSSTENVKSATLATLAAVASQCPSLKFFKIRGLDARGGLSTTAGISRSPGVVTFNFVDCPISSPSEVALSLQSIWPNADLIIKAEASVGRGQTYQPAWKAVQALVEYHRLVRRAQGQPSSHPEVVPARQIHQVDKLLRLRDSGNVEPYSGNVEPYSLTSTDEE
ncbi:hypothetical protein CALVIDRAFT_564768 [Calocera viscosa TUFC12733]|uniref:F-box domain-containing protein n=1 Tax=Calocera viscosa (strain TUFC12733) TaxID=1330018 RepID=A0A167L5P8_CALVF|nr:hypothetical protein CALVIDRAFT_564768 [Calocera viscosa TUFC12733]